MSLPKAKVNLYERRITRLKRQLDKRKLLHRQDTSDHLSKLQSLKVEFDNLRTHYGSIVAKHIATERKQTAKILEDTFKIQELDNQIAVQWKDNAGLAQDVRDLHAKLGRANATIEQQKETIADLRQ